MGKVGKMGLGVVGWLLAALVAFALYACADRLGAHGHHILEGVVNFLAFLVSPI